MFLSVALSPSPFWDCYRRAGTFDATLQFLDALLCFLALFFLFAFCFGSLLACFFKFIFRERRREGERGRETSMRQRNSTWLPLAYIPTRFQTCNPGMCPDWESNWRPFALQDDAQAAEPHQSGLDHFFFYFQVRYCFPLLYVL